MARRCKLCGTIQPEDGRAFVRIYCVAQHCFGKKFEEVEGVEGVNGMYRCVRCGLDNAQPFGEGYVQPHCKNVGCGGMQWRGEMPDAPGRAAKLPVKPMVAAADEDAPLGDIINVVKKGENVIYATFHRSPGGLTMHLRAHPAVEEFFKRLGNGTKKPVEVYGKQWEALAADTPVEIYHMNGPLLAMQQGQRFRIDNPGDKFYDENGLLNMSFLRIAGISTKNGVQFGIRGVYSLEKLRELQEVLGAAAKQLYRDYIKTVDLAVIVSTQEY